MGTRTGKISIYWFYCGRECEHSNDVGRLSPEREEDRPKVLIFAGPHWNGAVGVAAARILATQGIQTNVFVWNVEVPLFTTELQLYRLTKQTVTTDMNGTFLFFANSCSIVFILLP